jgi:hypothetical protein
VSSITLKESSTHAEPEYLKYSPEAAVPIVTSLKSVSAEGTVGVPLKSEYAPDVATVARLGDPLKSEYAPDVATVARLGDPLKSEYAPDVATVARLGVPLKSEYAS